MIGHQTRHDEAAAALRKIDGEINEISQRLAARSPYYRYTAEFGSDDERQKALRELIAGVSELNELRMRWTAVIDMIFADNFQPW